MNKFKAGGEKVLKFLKQNSYYVIMGICLIAIITMISVAVVNNNKPKNVVDKTDHDIIKDEDKPPKKDDDKPKEEKIVFGMPVENAVVGAMYIDTNSYYNETLEQHETHKYVDFLTTNKVDVKAVLDGTVESISNEKYYGGTIVTIKHKNNIRTIYKSLDKEVKVKVGDTVKKGDVIGQTSDSEIRQKKIGNHLHFEVTENKETINPNKYLTIPEK